MSSSQGPGVEVDILLPPFKAIVQKFDENTKQEQQTTNTTNTQTQQAKA